MKIDRGTLFVFSGPSGTGKGTILEKFNSIVNDGSISYSVSATTRKPRPGEKDGVNYYYKSVNEFESMIQNDEFLEWAKFCDNFYGTPKKQVFDLLENGVDVILEIETKGAMNIKNKCKDAVLVFILPPSLNELKSRLKGRGTETKEELEKRYNTALKELEIVNEYDYVIINDDINKATDDFISIVKSHRLKTNNNKNNIIEVLKNDSSVN